MRDSASLIPREQIGKLSYLRHIPRDGRIVPLLACFDSESREWRLYLESSPGEIEYFYAEPISGSYLAAEPVNPVCDLQFPLGTLVTRHLSYINVLEPLHKLENDLHRCAAILEKYHLLWRERPADLSASLLIESELEHLLVLLRSFYDLLQQLARQVIKRLVHLDESRRRVVQNLPHSFADVVKSANDAITEAELQARYGLPDILARWYTAEAPFFKELRKLRNSIVHYGGRLPTIFEVEWGFAIDPTQLPWSRFEEWPVERRWQGKLGALRPLFAGLILHSMEASTRLADILAHSVALPPSITELSYIIRSPFGGWLVGLNGIRQQPWEGVVG